ncbi:hypothetical protein EV360DRAFT_71791 [Lentinula raphanica]|nr:hypothetical protein EV360DRAFT_71791 [Lentinula raphanica]
MRAPPSGTRPRRTAADNHCLAAFVEFNGVNMFVLFDSGSTADAISPDFTRVPHLRMFQLENPVQLQLGTKGSRSQITYGWIAPYLLNVLGTAFMRKHGICLYFETDTVELRGEKITTLTEGEEVKELTRRNANNIRTGTLSQDENLKKIHQLIDKPSLNYLLSVLLDPEDKITMGEALTEDSTLNIQPVEMLRACADLFAQRASNESLSHDQELYTGKDIPRLGENGSRLVEIK